MNVIVKTFKTSPSSPQKVQMRSLRFDPGAPHLSLEELPSLNMDGSSHSKLPISVPSSNLRQEPHSPIPLGDAASRVNTPSRIPHRRSSGTPKRVLSHQEHLSLSSPRDSDRQSDGGDTSPWSGAVGKASLGKSGRVIERLMAEIDKHKRELNAEILHRQEIEKREDLNSRIVEGLKTENSNLHQAKETDAAVLKRRDRKIDELRADLDCERAKRLQADENMRQVAIERDEIVAKTNRQLSEARDVAKHAKSHAEVLEQSHKQLGTEYRQRTETLVNDLRRLLEDRDEEREKVKRLDVVVEQLKHEVERLGRLNMQIDEKYQAYKASAGDRIRGMAEEAKRQEDTNETLREEAERVIGEAKWLINIGKCAKERQERALG